MSLINKITGTTKLTGLLGSPVSHSKSPLMHNEAFHILGLDYVYLCFDIDKGSLSNAVNGLKSLGAAGFNCTMPTKTLMCELADELSPAASMIGAVNTVVNCNGKFIGHNTDGIGYIMSVKDAGFDIINKNMTLIGTGGAASSICVQAALDGVASIDVFGRQGYSFDKAKSLIDSINKRTACKASLYELSDAKALKISLENSDILTNATSVGMAPDISSCVITDASMLKPEMIVSDIIYNPLETALIKMAKLRGCHTFNGLYMLLYQGAESFKLWTGKEMPVNQIKKKFFNI